MDNIGSTSTIELVRPGVVLKQPINFQAKGLAEKVDLCFSVEPLILQRLGQHPRIVKYLGQQGRGLLLGQASHSNLQAYIDNNNPSIDLQQRITWCRQLAVAIAYIHSCGVVHSDLRPRNVLVHETSSGSLDLLLCDFGGSTCDELGLDGGCLPDGPFYHPTFGFNSTPALDIFSLGSLFYTVLTGRWPYRATAGPPETIDEKIAYEKELAVAFNEGRYPDVTQIVGGSVILGCWTKQYATAEEVLRALEREIPIPGNDAGTEADYISMFFRAGISVAAVACSLYILLARRQLQPR